MDYIIAIPTLNRSKVIASKTLQTLRDTGFLPSTINLFVASEAQKLQYQKDVPAHFYNQIIIGELGIAKQRNFITRLYPEGTRILFMDDDIRGFKLYKGFEKVHIPTLISDLFDWTQSLGTNLCGLYPAANPLFLQPRIRDSLCLICGSCFLMIVDHSVVAREDLSCKVDWFLSFVSYKKYGKLARADFIAPITTYWKGEGGLVDSRTVGVEASAAIEVMKAFPDYVTKVYMKKNGRPDLKLRKFPKFNYPVEVERIDGLPYYQTILSGTEATGTDR